MNIGELKKIKKPFIAVDRIRALSPFAPVYGVVCAGCGEAVEMVKADEAAAIAGTNKAAVIRGAARGEIHLGIVPDALLFCVNSLLKHAAIQATLPMVQRQRKGVFMNA